MLIYNIYNIFLFSFNVNFTWHMNWGIIRWKMHPLNPNPFEWMQSCRKFSTVIGTTSARNSITIRPTSFLAICISMNTRGFCFPSLFSDKIEDTFLLIATFDCDLIWLLSWLSFESSSLVWFSFSRLFPAYSFSHASSFHT